MARVYRDYERLKAADGLGSDKSVADAPEYRVPKGIKVVYSKVCGEQATRAWDKIFQRLRQ